MKDSAADSDRDPTVLARVRLVATRLGCGPSDLVALAVLLTGALAALGVVWWTSTPRRVAAAGPADVLSEPPATGPAARASAPVFVHVAGAVATPGVYELPAGARVGDALDAAAGPAEDADLDAINMARHLTDGEQLFVPALGEAPPSGPAASGPRGALRPDGRLDLNRATAAELEELPRIGPVLAERIVTHRDNAGPFPNVDALLEVPGIGEKLLAALVDLVAV